jgi:hypothetical protein
MIWDGFDGNQWTLYVMKRAGICVDECCGESGLMHAVFCGHNSGDQLTITAK